MADPCNKTTEASRLLNEMRTTISKCWDALGQARAHIYGETPDETSESPASIKATVLEMIDDAIHACRTTMR